MAKLIADCPQCRTTNEVIPGTYMRGDRMQRVKCKNAKCSLLFLAVLSDEDIEKLFERGSISPVIKGEEDYKLKSERYPD